MNIMIAGCGKVGKSIAMRLCDEGHQVTVIDIDEHALSAVTNSLDVMGYHGDCTSIRTLEEAGIKDTDLLITVTSDDEKNMLTCLIARKAGGCQTIARVRSPQYAEDIKYIKEDLGLSMSINPEKVAAELFSEEGIPQKKTAVYQTMEDAFQQYVTDPYSLKRYTDEYSFDKRADKGIGRYDKPVYGIPEELSWRDREIVRLEEQIKRVESDYQNSTCWKITAPIRVIGKKLGKE